MNGRPQQLVAVSALVVAGVLTLAEVQRGGVFPSSDQLLGVAIVYTALGLMSDLNVPIAGPLALLIMVTVLLTRGDDALGFARDKVRKRAPRRRRPRGGRGGTTPVSPGVPASDTLEGPESPQVATTRA